MRNFQASPGFRVWVGNRMTISVQAVKVNSSVQNAAGIDAPRSLQNNGQANNSPAFCGSPIVIKSEKWIKKTNWVGDDFNSAQQRLVSGITGILMQPWFELTNKRVDEDTRKVSTARICAKIIAGTLTGVLIRWGLIKAADSFTKTEVTENRRVALARLKHKANIQPARKLKDIKKWEQCLLPEKLKKPGVKFRDIKRYRNTFGTVAAVGVMLFTNFLIDAPLTTFLTNKFVKVFTGKDPDALSSKKKGGN